MTLRSFLVLLAFVPAVSLADAPRHAPRLALKPHMNPALWQATQDTAKTPIPIARNGHLHLEVYVGPAETVPITVLENGVPLTYARTIVTSSQRGGEAVDLVPTRELKAGALVVVSVNRIRSATFRVATAADDAAPTFVKASIEAFRSNVRAGPRWVRFRPMQDEVEVSVTVSDESTVRLLGVVTGADGGRIESTMSVFVSNTNATTTLLTFPAGSLPTSGPVALRLEAVDIAGNVATSNELVTAATTLATPDAATPVGSSAPDAVAVPADPPAPRRGC